MRVGVMGGTFDPIHLGHLIAAEEVRYALGLEKILFVPAGEPPHKEHREVSSAKDRVQMAELAIATNPYFELSLLEVQRPGRSYSVDTLHQLKEQLGPDVELVFIVGMDSLAELLTWREPARLISLARLAVVNRPPQPDADLKTLETRLPGLSLRIDMVKMPGIYIASNDLRKRVAQGVPIKYQVPEPVEQYIREKSLYSSSPVRASLTSAPSDQPPEDEETKH